MLLTGICGSLRRESHNLKLLRNAAAMLPADVEFQLAEWSSVPVYNQDLDGDDKPASVNAFKQAIEAADVVLIATPEYNYGIPGGLKNAIDWASRPGYQSVFAGKPTGMLSASMSAVGAVRAQGQLRQILAGMLTPVYSAPEFLLSSAHNAFDDDGLLSDDKTRQVLQRYINGLLDWVTAQRTSS